MVSQSMQENTRKPANFTWVRQAICTSALHSSLHFSFPKLGYPQAKFAGFRVFPCIL